MNRLIKFRAWDKTLNHGFWYWSPGDTDFDLSKELEKGKMPIMQFTGLHDKNGKEIYEGDIVQWPNPGMPLCYVRYSEDRAWFCVSDKTHWFNLPFREMGEDVKLEVIGNIYENPELLQPPKEPKE